MVQFRLPSPRKPKAESASAASTPDASSHPPLTHSISISDIDALPPMSEHILDHVLGKGRAIDRIESPDHALSVVSPRAGYSKMDSHALYWSKEGVVKRSATVTNRMHARGVKLEHETDPRADLPPEDVLDPTQPVPEPVLITYKSNRTLSPKVVAEKDTKHKLIAKANASVLQSLEAAYKPAQGDKVALSEIAHTEKAPSRHLQYVDGDGNVRSLSRTGCDTPLTAPPSTPPVDEAAIEATSPVVVEVQANKKRATKFWTKNTKAKDMDAELKKSESVPVKAVSPPVLKKSDSAGDAPSKPTTSGWRMKFGTKEKGKETTAHVVQASASTESAATSAPDVVPAVDSEQSATVAVELKKSESSPAKTTSPPVLQKSESEGDAPAKPIAIGWRAKFGVKENGKEATAPVVEALPVPTTTESATASEATPTVPTSDSAPTVDRVQNATASAATVPATEPSTAVTPPPVPEKKKMSGLFNKAKAEPLVKPMVNDETTKAAPTSDETKRKSAIKSVEKPKANPLDLAANLDSGSNQALNDTVTTSKGLKMTEPVPTSDDAETSSTAKLAPIEATGPSVSETKADAVSAGEVVSTAPPTNTVLSPSKKRGTFRNLFKARKSSMGATVN